MEPKNPIAELMDDHRLIEAVIAGMDAKLSEDNPQGFPAEFIEQALEFFVNFADGCHHYKEEEALFPALVNRGVPAEGGPVGMMLYEHSVGRKCLAGIRENLSAAREGSTEAQKAVRRFASEYSQLLRNHIWKEDNILFQMARQLLDGPAIEELTSRFHDQGNARIRSAVTDRCIRFAASL
jgi:hemerythrin-like domain-containing protein